MTEAFGYWLSGIIDGEGCFSIVEYKAKGKRITNTFGAQFALSLRSDDQETLKNIHDVTKLGVVRPSQNNMWIWCINSKSGCAGLIEILDKYPLQTRKLRDYITWKMAVERWMEHKRGGSWDDISKLKEAIHRGRKFS